MKANSSGSHHFATSGSRCSRSSSGVRIEPSLQHDAGQRPLGPALVRHRDHRRLQHVGMRHQRVLELDRGDPLAARLDQVLGAVGDPHEAPRVDRGDVAGAQPAVVELLGARTGPRSSRARSRGRAPRARRSSRRPTAPRAVVARSGAPRRAARSGRSPCGSASASSPSASAGGRATAPSGLVSVMPHACMIRTPWRSSKPRISDSGTAAPPQIDARAGWRGPACARPRSAAGPSRSSARRPRP